MKTRSKASASRTSLRRAAEAKLKAKPSRRAPVNEASLRRLQHELEVHQIELEMQNEELLASRDELTTALERYTELYDFAPVGYFNLTAKGSIRLVNLTGARLVGIERARLMGTPFTSLLAGTDRRVFGDFLAQAIATNARQTCELALASAAGPPLVVQLEATRSSDGTECRVVMSDITRRTETEVQRKMLLAEMGELKAALDQHAIVAITDALGKITFVNDKFCAISQYSREELLGQDHRLINSGFHPQEFMRNLWATITQGNVWHGEIKNRAKDGSFYWVATTIVPFLDARGKPRQYIAIRADITERKRAEEGLLESENRLRAIIETEPECVKVVSRDGHLLEMNLAGLEMLQAGSLTEAQQKPLLEFILPEHRAMFRDLHRRVMAGESRSLEFEITGLNGGRRWLETHATPLRNAAGQVQSLLGITRDITDRKKAREESAWLASFPQRNPHPILEIDLAGGVIHYANPATHRLLPDFAKRGMQHPLLAGLADVEKTLIRGKVIAVRREVAAGELIFAQSINYIPETGRLRLYHTDITDRKRAELASARLAAIVSSSDDAIIGEDLNRNVTSWNQGAEQIFGYTAGEMVGTSMLRLIPADRQDEDEHFLRKALQGESMKAFETLRLTQDGRQINVSVTASPIKDAAGKVIGVSKVARDITERKRSEAALQASRGKLEAALSSMTDAVLISDNAGQFVEVNDAFATFHRFKNKAECAMTLAEYPDIIEVFTPDGTPAPVEMWAVPRALRGETVANAEYTLHRKDTGETWVGSYSFSPIRDEAGSIVGSVVVGRDITELKLADAELREREEQLRLHAEHSPAAIAMFDRDMKYLVVSRRWMEDYRLGDQSIVGHSHYDVFPEMPQRWKDVHQRCLAGATEKCEEDSFQRSDGTAGWIHWEILPWRQADGKVGGLIIFSEDITARKVAEAALRESEANYHALFESASDGILVSDADGRFVDVNAAACRMLGYTRDELLKLGNADIVARDQPARIAPGMARLQTAGVAGGEWLCRRKDGTVFPAEVSASLLPHDRRLSVLRDVTGRKQAEAELQQTFSTLQLFIDSVPHFIAFVDTAERYQLVNRSYEEWFGQSREQIIGRTLREVHRPTTYADMSPHVREVMSGRPAIYENQMIGRDGSEYWFDVRLVPRRSAEGPMLGYFVLALNVTERKRAEASLRESQALYHSFLEQLPNAVFRKAAAGHYVMVNAEFCRLKGVKAEDCLGRHAREIAGFASAQQAAEGQAFKYVSQAEDIHEQIMRTGKIIEAEEEYPAADGGKQFFQSVRMPVFDLNNTVVGTQGILFDITDRKRAEAGVRASEERLRSILDTMFVFVGLMDLDGKIVEVNHAPLEAAGLKREDVLGKTVAESYWFAHSSALQARVSQALGRAGQGEIMREDYLIRVAGGGLITIDTTFAPLRDASGQVTQIVGSAVDVTERVQAEAAVRESQALYHSLVDRMPAGVFRKDVEGRYVFINSWFCRLKGMAPEGIVGKMPRELARDELAAHPPVDPTNATETRLAIQGEDHHQLIMRTGKTIEVEEEYPWPDGTKRNLQVTKIPVYDADKKIIGSQGLLFDITGRKQAELALRDSEERFRTMANSMSQLAWIAQPDGFIYWYNQRWYEYTGTTSAEMEGWGWQRVHDPEVLPKVIENWQAAIDAGEPFDMEFPLRSADGQFRTFLTRGLPLKNSAGQVVQWFGTNTDVEGLKQAEEKVRQLNAGLEQRVIERTAQLEATNKELEAFSYSVSHDLRAPLRAVNGFAKIVLEDYGPQLPEDARRFLDRIHNGGQRMGELIDDLLAFSRLGRQPMNRWTVDSTKLVHTVLADLEPQQKGRQIEIHVGDLPACEGDPALLKQVWVNLISNAIKYTRGREPAVIKIGCENKDGEQVYFVCDNGAGFDMQYAHKLFSVFQRLHRAEDFEGTGVGLAIVQRIIHRHGGRVWAEAAEGRGATFYFTLKKHTHHE